MPIANDVFSELLVRQLTQDRVSFGRGRDVATYFERGPNRPAGDALGAYQNQLSALHQSLAFHRMGLHAWQSISTIKFRDGDRKELTADKAHQRLIDVCVRNLCNSTLAFSPVLADKIRASLLNAFAKNPDRPNMLTPDPEQPWSISIDQVFDVLNLKRYDHEETMKMMVKWINHTLIHSDEDFLGDMQKESVHFLSDTIDQARQLGLKETAEQNIEWLSETTNFDSAQKEAAFLVVNAAQNSMQWESGFRVLTEVWREIFSERKIGVHMDRSFNWPEGTFNSLSDPNGWVFSSGLRAKTSDGVAPGIPPLTIIFRPSSGEIASSIAALINRDMVNSLATPFSSSENLYLHIAKCRTVPLSIPALDVADFAHIGHDLEDLLAMLRSDKPLKILLSGEAGSGKSTLLATVLQLVDKKAIEVTSESLRKKKADDVPFHHQLSSMRQALPLFGNPLVVVDNIHLEKLRNPTAFSQALLDLPAEPPMTEIWTVDHVNRISPEALYQFDMVIELAALPLVNRYALAKKLFPEGEFEEDLPSKIAKICQTPGELVRAKEWAHITGQTSWMQLSRKISSSQQASLVAKEEQQKLPITLFQASSSNGFSEVMGYEDVLLQAKKLVMGYKNPELFQKLGAKSPKGVLLTGGPGLGKTHLARAMAYEAGVPLLVADSASLAKSPELISKVFSEARRQAPCILFFDELDAIGATSQTTVGPPDPKRQAILNRMLTELDGFHGLDQVLVLGATHRAEVLDEALVRSGRLGWKINFQSPARSDRLKLWQHYTSSLPVDEHVDLLHLARISAGMSPADIAECANRAALETAMAGADKVQSTHFTSALDSVMWGEEKLTTQKAQKDIYRTSVHEAGHAVLAWIHGQQIERISVHHTTTTEGHVRTLRDEEQTSLNHTDLLHIISVKFGGLLAEQLILGSQSLGASSDLAGVRKIVRTMVRREAMGDRCMGVDWEGLSETMKSECERNEEALALRVKEESLSILHTYIHVVKMLAKDLSKYREFDGAEFEKWMSDHGMNHEDMANYRENFNAPDHEPAKRLQP